MSKLGFLAVFLLSASGAMAQSGGHHHLTVGDASAVGGTTLSKQALINDALSAAPPTIVGTTVVKDWDGSTLRDGSGDYVCFPTHPSKRAQGGKEPMCLDQVWQAWGHAWMNKMPFKTDKVGIAYMLAGDAGASNVDAHGAHKTSDNQWIVEGPHVMMIVPDHAQLGALPTEPSGGGAYVMWKDTPYAHIMVPVGARPKQ